MDTTLPQPDRSLPEPSLREHIQEWFRRYGSYVLIALGVLILVAVGLWFASLKSQPGDALYSMKVNVFEEMGSAIRLTSSAQASYEATRLERRFKELDALRFDTATTSEEVLAPIATFIGEHTDAALKNAEALAPTERLDLKLRLISLTDAHDTLAETSAEFTPLESGTGEARSRAMRALTEDAHTFASSSPSEAATYMGAQLDALKGELERVAPGSRAEQLAQDRLLDATDAIIDGAIGDALTYILRARQAITVDELLWYSERGPVGEAPAPGPIPEGN